MEVTFEIVRPAQFRIVADALARLADEAEGLVGISAAEREAFYAEVNVGETATEAAETPAPPEADDDTKPVRGKNAEEFADKLIEAFPLYTPDEWEVQLERLPKKLQKKVQDAVAEKPAEDDEPELPLEEAEEPEVENDDILDIDEPEEVDPDLEDVSYEQLKQLGEKLVLSLPQGEKQMDMTAKIRAVLKEFGADRFARVPEDKVNAVYVMLKDLG